jgi:hypothetical protein
METVIFEKNTRAIRHGNNISDVDAEYCTFCGVDVAHPVFTGKCAGGGENPYADCPHMRVDYKSDPDWRVGDLVTVNSTDQFTQAMGPGQIISFHKHTKGVLAVVHYSKYADTIAPCYRWEWISKLVAWKEPEPKKKPDPLLRQILNIVLKAWKEEGFTLEDL